MKRLLGISAVIAASLLLTGCVVTPIEPVYTAPVYYQPAPVIVPAPIYVRPAPYCYWTRTWDGYYRVYRNVRVCR
jgi:hypothetical protein